MEVTQAAPAAPPRNASPTRGGSGAQSAILAALGLAAVCVVGGLLGLGLFLWGGTGPAPLAERERPTASASAGPIPGAPIEVVVPIDTTAAQAPPGAAVAVDPAVADPAPVAPAVDLAQEAPASRRRRRRPAPRSPRPATAVLPTAQPGTASAAAPAAGRPPPTADRSDPVVRATEYSQRGDYMGCVRELRAARPTTTRILHARFACASSARNQSEIRDVCAEIMQRNPGDPMTPACTALSH